MLRFELRQALERAEREGRVHDAQQIRFLLGEMEEAPEEQEEDLEQYLVQEGDDPFSIAEEQLGSIEFLPDFLAENKHVYAIKPGVYMNLPKVGLMADPEPPEDDASRLVDLFETKGPPGPNWTAKDWALLRGFQPAQPDGTSSETAVEDTQTENPARGKEQPFTAPAEYSPVAPAEEDYTAEELAEAQEVLDVLLELGMPDPSEWEVRRAKKKEGPPPPPTPTPGVDQEEDGGMLEGLLDRIWELAHREPWVRTLLEWLGADPGQTAAPTALPAPEIIETTSTPTPTPLETSMPSLSSDATFSSDDHSLYLQLHEHPLEYPGELVGYPFVTRFEWGALDVLDRDHPDAEGVEAFGDQGGYLIYSEPIGEIYHTIIIHDTGVPRANYPGSSTEMVQSTQSFHQAVPEYDEDGQPNIATGSNNADIGYHFMITPDGLIFEGRDLRARGAHVAVVRDEDDVPVVGNTGSLGIALVGDDEREEPTEEQVGALDALIDYLTELLTNIACVAGHGTVNPDLRGDEGITLAQLVAANNESLSYGNCYP